MANAQRPDVRRYGKPLAVLAVAVLVTVVWPPFHVRRIGDGSLPKASAPPSVAAVDVPRFAVQFWNEKLVPAGDAAVDAKLLGDALLANADAAADRYGRRAGLGGDAVYLLQATGRISALDDRQVTLNLDPAGKLTLVIPRGPIFGNVLRDSSGLLAASAFSSFDFNALSSELNIRAETVVKDASPRLAPGASLRLAGGAEVAAAGGRVLFTLTPTRIEPAP
ncbi:MAG: hypothetical protein RLZZ200_1381 [Pseudomonadota bacterium]|jgi:hypothetical protein